ncbi:uncharacterized protein LOC132610675 isoform X2 [Lycium barbarum]|uniref:uncharacterized protein LOC132610675 isoform X2 n=1 Tax=Lycium barbarum TaxID=112863 RepID=UPI00293EB2EE|nr:uncharacterized protein LOC132610675 isoform X2 [Lycium barbarum]
MSTLLRAHRKRTLLPEIKRGDGPNKHEQSGPSPYLDSTAVPDSSNSQKMLHSSQRFERRRNASCENQEVIIDAQTNNQSKRKKLSTTWNATGKISLEDLQQNYGKNREEAAESLQVSVSTFKRICRKHGIPRWPSSKRKKGKCLLSAQKCNASGQSFSTSSRVIEALEESSLRSTPSKHEEASMSLNHNMLGTGETTKGNNILQERASARQGVTYKSQQHKPRNGSISFKSSMLGALEKGSQPPRNGMPCEEDIETSSISRKKRERLEEEAYCMDPMTHFEGKLPETLNYTSKRQEADGTSKGPSCLSSISWTSGGFNKDSNLSLLSITGHVVDDMGSTRMGVQPCLASMSANLLSSPSCNENTAQSVKLRFNNLIALPLKDLTDPANEASMKETLSILADNLFLFSEEQTKRIVDLKLEFTSLVHSWREYSRSQMQSQKFFTDLEKTRNMAATSAKDKECLKIRYEELQRKKEELMAQLEAVQKEQDGVAEQGRVKSKETEYLVSLAEEKARRTKEKNLVMTTTRDKLNNLVDRWAAIPSLFM